MQCIPPACPKISDIAAPVREKIEEGKPKTFDTLMQKEHRALGGLMEKLPSWPSFALPRGKGYLRLDKDTSLMQRSCVLMQGEADLMI